MLLEIWLDPSGCQQIKPPARTLASSLAPRGVCLPRPQARAPASPAPLPAAPPDLLAGDRAAPSWLSPSPRRPPAAPGLEAGLVLGDLAAAPFPPPQVALLGDACRGLCASSSVVRVIFACFRFDENILSHHRRQHPGGDCGPRQGAWRACGKDCGATQCVSTYRILRPQSRTPEGSSC